MKKAIDDATGTLPAGFYQTQFKRMLDIMGALGLGVVTAPLWILTALAVRIALGSPVMFRQQRPGLNGRLFTLYKFRTMSNERDDAGELLDNERRLTSLGAFIRATSLDELPQLINILKGDMSLVGPRPLLEEYLPYYSEKQFQRHSVLPGITGLAQINGRNHLTWEEKFEYDLEYVRNVSLKLDTYILLKTVMILVTGSGAEGSLKGESGKFRG